MARYKNIADIINQVAVEVGIPSVIDPFSSSDAAMRQLTVLSNSCAYELLEDIAWEGLVREHQITTLDTDTGNYPLPDDFAYMINQTGWDRTNNVPIIGPLSAQEWQYLEGRDLVSHTIYASFREVDGQYSIFPQPPPNGLDLHFEYVSRNWVLTGGVPDAYDDKVVGPADIVLYEPTLFERLLKLRFLEARGFDTATAAQRYDKALSNWTSHDKGAPILNGGRSRGGVPYLDSFYNTPDTNFGGV